MKYTRPYRWERRRASYGLVQTGNVTTRVERRAVTWVRRIAVALSRQNRGKWSWETLALVRNVDGAVVATWRINTCGRAPERL